MTITEKELSDREYQMLQAKLQEYNRSHGVAYLLWFFLGTLGVHKFYIGKAGMGVLYIGLLIVSSIGFVATFGDVENVVWWVFPGGALGAMLIYDLFSIPSQINKVKEGKKAKIISEIKSTA